MTTTNNPFVALPTLEGKSLVLRPLQNKDFEALYAAASDPLIWAQHPEPTRYQRDVFQRFFDSATAGGSTYVVIDKASDEIIGSSRYYEWNPEKREVTIGYTFLARSHWGGSANRELKRLMLDHAFEHVRTVWFHVGKDNLRSRQAMEKVGAVLSHGQPRGTLEQMQEYVCYRMDSLSQLR